MAESGKRAVDPSLLPVVDDQAIFIDAPAAVVWRELGVVVGQLGSRGVEVGGRLLGVRPTVAGGDPLFVGSTLPGFATVRAEPCRELVFHGQHRFSRYVVTFRLAAEGARTMLHAETRAIFPGVIARLYQAVVVDSRLSEFGTLAMLRKIRRRARG
ncbi:hypothetical protein OG203_41200 [Nocardia sp. NBC_01499]|uniref:hypothetical protein n=1 Tax=Nocardia sp. NBC_01499 TaxID=2903597 RepID=UPI00386A2634